MTSASASFLQRPVRPVGSNPARRSAWSSALASAPMTKTSAAPPAVNEIALRCSGLLIRPVLIQPAPVTSSGTRSKVLSAVPSSSE